MEDKKVKSVAKLITQPDDLWSEIDAAAKESEMNRSEWLGEAALQKLGEEVAARLSGRRTRGPEKGTLYLVFDDTEYLVESQPQYDCFVLGKRVKGLKSDEKVILRTYFCGHIRDRVGTVDSVDGKEVWIQLEKNRESGWMK